MPPLYQCPLLVEKSQYKIPDQSLNPTPRTFRLFAICFGGPQNLFLIYLGAPSYHHGPASNAYTGECPHPENRLWAAMVIALPACRPRRSYQRHFYRLPLHQWLHFEGGIQGLPRLFLPHLEYLTDQYPPDFHRFRLRAAYADFWMDQCVECRSHTDLPEHPYPLQYPWGRLQWHHGTLLGAGI